MLQRNKRGYRLVTESGGVVLLNALWSLTHRYLICCCQCIQRAAPWLPTPNSKHRQRDSSAWLNPTPSQMPTDPLNLSVSSICFAFTSIFNAESKTPPPRSSLVLQGRWNKSKRLPGMDKSRHQACRSIIFRSHFVYCSLFKCWKSRRQRENTEWMLPKIAPLSLCCVWWPPAGSWRDCTALLCTDCWPDLPALGGLPRAEQVHFVF